MTKLEPFPKGDVRRLLALALAIAEDERATLTTLSARTGHHKQTIQDDVEKLRDQLGIAIEKEGPVYRLVSWGPVIKQTGLRKFLLGQLI
ncbi:helix-turn-helix domain-containing protein [Burkholderia vietnamiensis]|uniref:helix-turn-helix domain-containing protein n=1 Tax=Burkholderia vietnamiensis TaxID=60552 RepID=UPI0020135464|nr:helix-turn-helix domain-containing protein [Burkholderia vietnamiensis]